MKCEKKTMKALVNYALSIFDAQLVRKSSYEKLLSNANRFRDYELSALIDEKFFEDYFKNLRFSKSQLRQDLFVLSEHNFKENGFFVEFGSTNGVDLSNTYILETKFNWKGILAEPAKIWHSSLKDNRSAAMKRIAYGAQPVKYFCSMKLVTKNMVVSFQLLIALLMLTIIANLETRPVISMK